MKTNSKLITCIVLVAILILSFSVNAQDKEEIKVKIIKEVNGKTTTIDTVLINTDVKDVDFSGLHLTEDVESIINELKKDKAGDCKMKIYMFDGKKCEKGDSLMKIWVELDEEYENKKEIEKKVTIICSNDGKFKEHSAKNMLFISDGDDVEMFKDTSLHNCQNKMMIKKYKSGDSADDDSNVYVWVSESGDVSTISEDSLKVIRIKNIISETGDKKDIQVFVTADGEDVKTEKAYKVIVKSGDDGNYKTVVMNDGEGEFYSNEDVFVLKTGDESKIHKSIIMIKDLNDDDKKLLVDIKKDVNPGNELDISDLKLMYEANTQKLNLNLEVKDKATLKINIFDKSGKSSFTDEQKNFSGIYTKELDLTADEYFIQISRGKKTATRKLIIK